MCYTFRTHAHSISRMEWRATNSVPFPEWHRIRRCHKEAWRLTWRTIIPGLERRVLLLRNVLLSVVCSSVFSCLKNNASLGPPRGEFSSLLCVFWIPEYVNRCLPDLILCRSWPVRYLFIAVPVFLSINYRRRLHKPYNASSHIGVGKQSDPDSCFLWADFTCFDYGSFACVD